MNIGIFGGRFDPIHRGHISLASAAMEKYSLGRVLFVPVNSPPHKDKQTITEFVHRYAMVALATAEEKRFVPSLLEGPAEDTSQVRSQRSAERGGSPVTGHRTPAKASDSPTKVNYTIDTVRRVKRSLKKADRLFFLIGIDAFRDIAKWHEARALLGECDFVVASRPGYSLRDVAEALPEGLRPAESVTRPFHKQPASGDLVLPGVTLHLLEGVHQNVSATAIRAAAASGKALGRWLDPCVAEYVRKVGLYR
ncbi:MAG: nicotinate-nicotinamide nucleotide adenylyltransferase [Terriglobales bacterium]